MGHDSIIKMLIRKHVHGVREREGERKTRERECINLCIGQQLSVSLSLLLQPAASPSRYIHPVNGHAHRRFLLPITLTPLHPFIACPSHDLAAEKCLVHIQQRISVDPHPNTHTQSLSFIIPFFLSPHPPTLALEKRRGFIKRFNGQGSLLGSC